jgi:hypothetical protein
MSPLIPRAPVIAGSGGGISRTYDGSHSGKTRGNRKVSCPSTNTSTHPVHPNAALDTNIILSCVAVPAVSPRHPVALQFLGLGIGRKRRQSTGLETTSVVALCPSMYHGEKDAVGLRHGSGMCGSSDGAVGQERVTTDVTRSAPVRGCRKNAPTHLWPFAATCRRVSVLYFGSSVPRRVRARRPTRRGRFRAS